MIRNKVHVLHSSHLDLFWIGAQADCLEKGSEIINEALMRAEKDESFYFLIETARFLEYFVDRYPERLSALRAAVDCGQIELAASYTDRLENHFGGESLVRNVLYGRKIIRTILDIDCKLCFHPDLPGFTEQTPQIYKKSGILYYVSARGFKYGARFLWEGLDGSTVTMYNVPAHYAYYDIDEAISAFEFTKQHIESEEILISCSAGDMGEAGTFIAIENGKAKKYDIQSLLNTLNKRYPQYEFVLSNAMETIDRMPKRGLKRMRGEYPSRWGHHGSALNVQFYRLDKLVERFLTDAEKLATVCSLLHLGDSFSLDRHPLLDPGGNNGQRRYWDLKKIPRDTQEWIEFAWRLQMVTQDHNFGGVEGAQTEFDRTIYKCAAIKIANGILNKSLRALAIHLGTDKNMVCIVNTLNWERNEIVTLNRSNLDPARRYSAIDNNTMVPLVYSEEGWQFLATQLPSFGVKNFRIEEQSCLQDSTAQILDLPASIVLQNHYYRVEVSKKSGCVISLLDLELQKEWAGEGQSLCITALRDESRGGSERIVDKPVLDRSSENVRFVGVKRLDALMGQIQVVTEVLDVKVILTISLLNHRKEVLLKVDYNWPGTPDIQMKMELIRRTNDSQIIYGVPYGAQIYGHYLETDSLKFGSDEISYELFNRYREIQGFYSIEENNTYLTVASNQSALDFAPDTTYVLLARDVRNGAEQDYRFTNAGMTSFRFSITSGPGSWAQSARMTWEHEYPVYVQNGEDVCGQLSSQSFITTQGTGILTVFAPLETGSGMKARIFNPTPVDRAFTLSTSLGIVPVDCINMDETPASEPLNILGGYEIKTISLG